MLRARRGGLQSFRWTFGFRFATVQLRRMQAVTNGGGGWQISGRRFTAAEVTLIREVVETCSGLSRKELANTVSELVGWTRPGGGLKEPECLAVLAKLEAAGLVALPAKQPGRPVGSRTAVPRTGRGDPGPPLIGRVEAFAPVVVQLVEHVADRQLFRELIDRYHYLRYAVPYGAHVEYLVSVSMPVMRVVGGLQFSSAAWRMRVRDQWIGWDDATRARGLPRVVTNSRFLLAPWIQVKNLASTTLSVALRRLPGDWHRRYGVEPVLVETLVDPIRYRGDCYRASNWLELGETAGRGRDDRAHARHGARPKRVFVYPLTRQARAQLRGED